MADDEPTGTGVLVPSPHRELAPRSAALVRRGLDDLSMPIITARLLQEIDHSLVFGDFQARVEAARSIMRLAPYLDIQDEVVGCVVTHIVGSLVDWSAPTRDPTRYVRTDSGPYREVDLRDVFTAAFHAVLGPDASLEGAILQVLSLSHGRAREIAVNLLVRSTLPKSRAGPVLHAALKEATGEWEALVLRYALAMIFGEDVDSVYRDLVRYHIASYADTRPSEWETRWSLWYLGPRVSSETAAECFCTLAAEGRPDLAESLFLSSVLLSVGKSCSQDAWLRMMQIAWTQFLQDTGNTHLAALHPSRNAAQVRALLRRAPHPPYHYPSGLRADSLKDTLWGRVLATLMDARIGGGGSQNVSH